MSRIHRTEVERAGPWSMTITPVTEPDGTTRHFWTVEHDTTGAVACGHTGTLLQACRAALPILEVETGEAPP